MDLAKLGGRRFILAASTELFAVMLVWFAKIPPDAFVVLVLGTVGALIGAHTVENVKVKPNVPPTV